MDKLTREQLRDLMHAVRHYQYHHISIKNPRYEEFSHILNVLEQHLPNEDISGYGGRRNNQDLERDWVDRWRDDESDADTQVGG